MTPRLTRALVALLLIGPAAPAAAQPADPRGFAPPPLYLPERYEPRGGGGSFLTIAVPDFDKSMIDGGDRRPVMGFRLLGNISRNAYTPVTDAGASLDNVAWRYVTEPVLDLRLLSGTIVAAGLPIVLQRGRVEPYAGVHQGDSVGDGWTEAVHAWRAGGGYLGGAARLTVPTGNEDLAFGNGALRLLAELIAGHAIGPRWLVAGSLGYRKAFPAKADRSAGDELVYRLGGTFSLDRRVLRVETALVGAIGANGPVDDRVPSSHRPLEWLLGVRWPVFSRAAAVHFGLGLGLDRGEGMPLTRFLVGLEIACALGDCLRPGGPLPDSDRDGVPDIDDDCPAHPEDGDGFEDDDGCPEIDNDNDGIKDDSDACPDAPEDLDGFEDADGCADGDDDGDNIPDAVDRCPREPEDHDGYQDTDGCPELDEDNDGIPDTLDICPRSQSPRMQQLWVVFRESREKQVNTDKEKLVHSRLKNSKEDIDGFEDEDGCPDYDHDKDGVPEWDDLCDAEPGAFENNGCPYKDGDDTDGDGIGQLTDRCLGEPETFNGFVDGDGCREIFIREDLRKDFTVDDQGQITLKRPLDVPTTLSEKELDEAKSPHKVDEVAAERARLAALLAGMLNHLGERAIRLQMSAPARSTDLLEAFVEAFAPHELGDRLLPLCGMTPSDPTPLVFSLCLDRDPERIGPLHSGLPQNLPRCPDEDTRKEHRCTR